MLILRKLILLLLSIDSFKNHIKKSKDYKVVCKGDRGVKKGRHIVFIATDHEYRGEESLPVLTKILTKRYGFKCTVIWTLDDNGYIFTEGLDLKVLARRRILNGMTPDSEPNSTKEEIPVAWVRKYVLENSVSGRVFTTKQGASEDLLNTGFRRMLINACFWGVG